MPNPRVWASPVNRVFSRIVVGIDDAPESAAAAAQSELLRAPLGSLHLVPIGTAGMLERASAPALLAEAERRSATLIAVGTRGVGRVAGLTVGAHETLVLRQASCSVLVARGGGDDWRPHRIVVGVDGSPESLWAFAVADDLAARHDSQLAALTALGGKRVDRARVVMSVPSTQLVAGSPVEALAAASRDADLVVVGTRGLHGFQALGSVSERVAHRARCSVLVVRAHAVTVEETAASRERLELAELPNHAWLAPAV